MEKKLLHCWILAYALLVITITNFQIPSSCLAQSSNRSLATDQAALLSLKSHVASDPSRILATNWPESSPVCSWHGVTCGLRHRRVYALNLSNLNISGTIPPQLGQLSFLVYLDLTSNNFTGALPQELSLLRRLKLISLQFNNFTGDIPPLFAQFPQLEHLNLRNNTFTGPIPESLSNLTNLQYLNINYNSLSGEIPQELGRLQSLQELRIVYNHLSGAIPSTIFNMSNLAFIALTGNELSGGLPTDMCTNLPFLTGLFLSTNQLSGPIPTNLSRCSQLETLSLSFNSFSGSIPAEIGYLTSLQTLGLGTNNLNGRLPREIGNLQSLIIFGVEINEIEGPIDFKIFMNMSSLDTLLLWRNRFSGNLITDVGNLTTLTTLALSENLFTGIIPREIGQLSQLDSMTLGMNNLSGSIPHELFNISTLRNLELSLNSLSGNLPTDLLCHASPILEGLYLATNFITGPIPNSISNCSQLTILVLNENKFSGLMPTYFGNLRFLEVLEISSNNLTNAPSSVPLDFITPLTNCRFLTKLNISRNPLYGIIPASVGNLSSSLQVFDASSCKFNGSIPVEIGNLTSLGSLDLHGNELSGNIPLTFKHLQELQGLFLSDNSLGGSIPETICDLHNLTNVDISRNQFSGPIPGCLGNVSSLRKVFLGSNLLNSSIPPTLWNLQDLTDLDLSSNSLSGFLPEEISNLGASIYINLSMNQLSGSIPNTIGKLVNLVNLSLAHNRLEGAIPVSMGSMTSLVTLDLSYNNISGTIPKSLEALKHLQYFNVSFNHLSGEIPTGGLFQNFTADSFEGNEALCGISSFHVRICPDHKSKRNKVKLALYVVVGVAAFIMVVSLAFICVRYKRKDNTTGKIDVLPSIEPERISYHELVLATEQFNGSNLLGAGSSGSVYKGTLNNGKVIAVKVFNMLLEGTSRRFDVECEMLRNIRHRNLTSVVSCCSNEEFKALVLEYMPKGNLDQWLYSHNYCLSVLERLNIMIDVASALEYLHHGYSTSIVHSDMKPSNVLLDEDMVAHVSDFGIAKLLSNGDSFVLTKTFATLGYIAPEYGSEGLVSTMCDVYSYGITLMETFTRKRPSDDMFVGDLNLKRWVENSLAEMPDEVIDANLVMNMREEQFNRNMHCASSILELALLCSADSPAHRIKMKEAHAELQKIKRRFLQ